MLLGVIGSARVLAGSVCGTGRFARPLPCCRRDLDHLAIGARLKYWLVARRDDRSCTAGRPRIWRLVSKSPAVAAFEPGWRTGTDGDR